MLHFQHRKRTLGWNKCFSLAGLQKVLVLSLVAGNLMMCCDVMPFEVEHDSFHILCTSNKKVRRWGSYKIRCDDLKRIAERCTDNVKVSLLPWHRVLETFNSSKASASNRPFNATISIKRGLMPDKKLGRVFIDIVDEYKLQSKDLSPEVEVIVQNERHGRDKFADRKYHVVEHWFNSFPKDMFSGSDYPDFPLPSVDKVSNLRMATVWDAGNQSCPVLYNTSIAVEYSCINKPYAISKWYETYFQSKGSEISYLRSLLEDSSQGPGRLYFELFWKFDVLVIPAKVSNSQKIVYGNVQRAVSQMRSGVPVLLEIAGPVLEDFMDIYNYTCVFSNGRGDNIRRNYWTFDEATAAMRSMVLRETCRDEGLRIAKYYSPKNIVRRELRILGYRGSYQC
mmetsp:Transcript_10277/g.24642  ORF Transcript_10277/g.24642 Transcript_10277/m.24642 type:complete len:395 (+) Transcript_10277:63-1247(+)